MDRIVDSPELAPGCDAFTLTDVGPFIDTLRDFDDFPAYGRMYLSRSTVSTMAQAFGFVPPETHQRVVDEVEAHKAEEGRLLEELNKLTAVKALLDSWAGPRQRPPTPSEPPLPEVTLSPEQIAQVASIDPELFDETPQFDTPDGEPLPDTTEAVAYTGTDAVVAAWYGQVPDNLAAFIELDPPPGTVEEIKEWIAEPDNEVIAAIRTEIAIAVEKQAKKPRPTVLALAEADPEE